MKIGQKINFLKIPKMMLNFLIKAILLKNALQNDFKELIKLKIIN